MLSRDVKRSALNQLIADAGSEFLAVRSALLTLFSALPGGALAQEGQETERAKRPKKGAILRYLNLRGSQHYTIPCMRIRGS